MWGKLGKNVGETRRLQLPRRRSTVAETRMLVRTETEIQFARDHVAAWNVTPWPTTARRKADETSDKYTADAEALEHNYAIFASAYAPMVDAGTLEDPDAGRYVIGVPIAHVDGLVALVPTSDRAVFAVPYDSQRTLEQHYQLLTEFLPCDAVPYQA